jgi:TolB-like protein/Tfp pilus assembly protein PilF
MPSLIQGFEYDVFISYRHKDNKYDGWVTEFVANLRKELEATFKEDVSVYFDANPHDGLLETHQVDDSLKSKLKCLVFIPIISQTYCDPKSFAWQNEFIAFRDSATSDQFGLKVKLLNGNVASRILPIRIHEIDPSDKAVLEQELGGVMRCVDFIYKSSGVNRPLRPREEETNYAHTVYRNQINKVANAIKEILQGLGSAGPSASIEEAKSTSTQYTTRFEKPKFRKRVAFVSTAALIAVLSIYGVYYFSDQVSRSALPDRSIAVIPFTNLSEDKGQDYFSDGITEDILNHLVKISDLKVKSRTSTLQYKNTNKDIPAIGTELGVSNVVEGSIRKVGNKVRIVVQLIDVKTDIHLWSETFDREIEDVFTVQSEIASEIARVLKAKLTEEEKENINRKASENITAYDYYLRARQIMNVTNYAEADYINAMSLLDHAIELDRKFAKAYAMKGRLWHRRNMFGLAQSVWRDSALHNANKAIEADPTLPDGYLERSIIHRAFRDIPAAKADLQKALEIAPNEPQVLESYGFDLLLDRDKRGAELIIKSIDLRYTLKDPQYYREWMPIAVHFMGDYEFAARLLEGMKKIDPGSATTHFYDMMLNMYRGNYGTAIKAGENAVVTGHNHSFMVSHLAWSYYLNGEYEKALATWGRYVEIEKTFEDSTQYLPFRCRMAMAYLKMGKKKEAHQYLLEEIKLDTEMIRGKRGFGAWHDVTAAYYDLAVSYGQLGDQGKAYAYLDTATMRGFPWYWGIFHDPALASLRATAAFQKIKDRAESSMQFRKAAFEEALNSYSASQSLKKMLNR